MITNKWINGQEELAPVLAIRKEATGEDRDDFDAYAMHVIMYTDEQPAATGRLYHDGRQFKMDKLCVLPAFRGQHIGDLMARLLLYKSMEFAPRVEIVIPQTYTEFYQKFGFRETEREGETVTMQVKKEEITFPSECHGKEK